MWASTMLQVMSLANVQSPFTQCSDNSPRPISYNYDNCSDIICCRNGGITESFQFSFITNQHVTSLQLQIRAVTTNDIYTITELPPPEPNACSGLEDVTCPLNAGQIVTYRTDSVIPVFPEPLVAFVDVRMVDQDNNTLCCLVHVLKLLPPMQDCEKK